jgi:hypothetical protein
MDDCIAPTKLREQAMPEGLSAPVVGPSTIFPRGYLWLAPFWYAVALALLAAARWLPSYFRITAAAGLLLAMLTFVCVLSLISARAFAADQNGVWLGLPTSTKRRGSRRREVKYLPWQQLEKVRIARRLGGARVEFILSPDASLALRGYDPNPLWKFVRGVLLIIPFAYVLQSTGVTTPRGRPARYQVRLRDVTIDELRQQFRTLAPANVTVAVLVRKRGSVPSSPSASATVDRAAYRAAGRL